MKSLLNRFRNWRNERVVARAVRQEAQAATIEAARQLTRRMAAKTDSVRGMNISSAAAASLAPQNTPPPPAHKRYEPPKDVVPAGLAMDDGVDYGYVNAMGMGYGGWLDGGFFKGYPYLAQLQVQPEFRKITETIAEEMTRKWIKLKSRGGDDKADAIEELGKALERYKVRDVFRTMALYDGFYGRGQLYIDVKTPSGVVASANPDELKTILIRSPAKIKTGALIGFKCIEPVWTYPGQYDSTNPLSPLFYKPQKWYVMAQEVHASRLISFISRPVPDLLKPSYNFGGLSMSQLAEPYVNNWLRTRDSVSDLVHSFSLAGIATDLGTLLMDGGGAEQMTLRAQLFNQTKDNRGLMLINKDTEEYFQHDTPLSGLDKLQAQAQEQMATPASIPLVKFFGITPSGLNASSDGEVRVFYDHIHASQEADWRDPLTAVIEIVQLSEFGSIDPDITFEFLPLWEPDEAEEATIRKTDADTDAVLISSGVITQDEARERLIGDPTSPYDSLESNPQAKDITEVLSEEEESRAAELKAKTEPPEPVPNGQQQPTE